MTTETKPMIPNAEGQAVVNDDTATIYSQTEGRIYSFALANGRTCWGNESLEELNAAHPGKDYIVIPFAEALERSRAREVADYCHPLEAITRARFDEMLNVLPPQCWKRKKGWEAFRMMEYTTGSITAHYIRIGDRHFTAQREIGPKVYETLKAEAEALIASEPKKLERPRSLQCACCGETTKGRQWWNRDTGWGVCPKCFQWIASKEGQEEAERSYGKPGVHHSLPETVEA